MAVLPNGAIIGIMILFLSIIAVVLFIVLGQTNTSKPAPVLQPTPPVPLTIDDFVGASTNGNFALADNGQGFQDATSCKAAFTTHWNQTSGATTCECLNPFFGLNCFRESYDVTYFAVGNPTTTDVVVAEIDTFPADRLSFEFINDDLPGTPIICSETCDENINCSGFVWTPPLPPTLGTQQRASEDPNGAGVCTLLTGDVVVNPDIIIPYDVRVDSTLYLKDVSSLIFTDRVFIYTNVLPNRFYLRTGLDTLASGQMMPVIENQVLKLAFIPTKQYNTAGLTGIYADRLITSSDITQIQAGVTPTDGMFFIVPPDVVDLPVFGVPELWVVYVLLV